MEFVKLIPINRICPCCGNGNYMRIISGKYVGEVNVKCINCNSYYNYDELLKRDNSKPLNGAGGRKMDDLISREAAIEEIARRDTTDGTVKVYSGREINAILSDLPAVDAVPVVRCRDCKHRPTYTGFVLAFPDERCPCQCADAWYNWYPGDDWFCANGERRDDDGKDA